MFWRRFVLLVCWSKQKRFWRTHMMKKIIQWDALIFGISTRTTFISALYFYRKKKIMKRWCGIEMPTGTKAFLASSKFSVKQLGGVQQCWTSLSQTPHNCKTLFSCHVHCANSVRLLFSDFSFKKGTAYSNQDPEDVYQWETAVCLDKLLWCQRPSDIFSVTIKTTFFDSGKFKNKQKPQPTQSRHACKYIFKNKDK